MRNLPQLWQGLERIAGLTTTTPYWKRYCGPDYEVIRPFLHATEFSGGTYPCGNTDREGCCREIVYCGGNKIGAVCRQEWDPCEEVSLCSDDAGLYELDIRSFTATIAESLGFRWQNSPDDGRCPWVIGLLSEGPGIDRTVFLIIETSIPRFTDSILRVIVHSKGTKAILAPTNRFKDADVQKLLSQHGIPLYPLEELILGQDDGTLSSPNTLADIVSGKAARGTATVGVSGGSRHRGRGFDANAADHRKVAAAAAKFGEEWIKNLPDLCRELHRAEADLPKYCKEEETMETWEKIAEAVAGTGNSSAREKVSAHVRYRLKWIRNNTQDSR